MAVTEGTLLFPEPLGAGYHGRSICIFGTCAAGVEENPTFGKFKLNDVNHVVIKAGAGKNGAADAFATPDTMMDIAADGKSIAIKDAAGCNYAVEVTGDWVIK